MARFGLFIIISIIVFSCTKTKGRPPSRLPTVPTPTISSFMPDTGGAGTEVTISGYNFSADPLANTVRFNGIIAEVTSAAPNTLTVLVPPDALSGRIAVTVKERTYTSITLFTVLNGLWFQKADFGGSPRGNAAGFSIGGKAYILTGYAQEWQTDFWEYDTTTNQWAQKADFPGGARERAVAFTIADKGYVGLGYNTTDGEHKDFWEYDPATDAWTRKADFAGKAREGAVAFSVANKGYVGLGVNLRLPEYDYKDMWKYDPSTDQWTPSTSFPGSASYLASGLATDTVGYVIFGTSTTNGGATTEFWEFNPATGNWSALNNFPGKARTSAKAFVINGKVYAGFGYDLKTTHPDIWEYNPGNFFWTRQASCPGPARSDLVGFAIGNSGYIGTGYSKDGDALKDFWKFTP